MMSQDDVIRDALVEALRHTSQGAWAARHGLSREHVNRVLAGARVPGPKIRRALGFTVVYAKRGEG